MDDQTLTPAILMGVAFFAYGIGLLVLCAPRRRHARALSYAMRVELPLPETDAVQRRIARSERASLLGGQIGVLACSLVVALGASPATPSGMYALAAAIIGSAVTVAAVSAALRDRLFAPARDAVRVARGRQLRTRDYIGPVRRLAAPVLLVAALCCLIAAWPRLTSTGALLVGATAAGATLVFAASLVLERAVLRRPQPASDVLELAWDDLFRAETLGTLRVCAAFAAGLALGLVAGVLAASGDTALDAAGVLNAFPPGIPVALVALFSLALIPQRLPRRLRLTASRRPRPAHSAGAT